MATGGVADELAAIVTGFSAKHDAFGDVQDGRAMVEFVMRAHAVSRGWVFDPSDSAARTVRSVVEGTVLTIVTGQDIDYPWMIDALASAIRPQERPNDARRTRVSCRRRR